MLIRFQMHKDGLKRREALGKIRLLRQGPKGSHTRILRSLKNSEARQLSLQTSTGSAGDPTGNPPLLQEDCSLLQEVCQPLQEVHQLLKEAIQSKEE